MSNYIWAAIVVVIFLFTLMRMKQEYRRGFHAGATKVLEEWKQYMKTEDNNEDIH
jgi:uncharacterized membrane protein YgaE (UPF0421/DUF939 family)